MKIIVNGKEIAIESPMSIKEYLESRSLNPSMVVVEHNFTVPEREKWSEIVLREGDNLEIVKFIGGG